MFKMKKIQLFVFFLLCLSSVLGFRKQSAAVKGKLMCGNKPAGNVLVKLFDEDDGKKSKWSFDISKLFKMFLRISPETQSQS